jgi:hypothetical protein
MNGLDVSRVPVVGPNQTILLGQIMANYGFVTTIPSWCSEKKREVSVDKSIWSATLIATTTFFLLGYMGALAFHFPDNGDILSVINNSKESNAFDRVLVYLFPLMVLATTIPVFSIIVRYNLLQNKVFPKGISNFVAVVLPWLVVIPFLTGDGLNNILNWGSLVFSSVANFIIPFVVYLRASGFRDRASTVLSEKQHIILTELGLRDNKLLNSDRDFGGQKPYQALPPSLSEYSRKIALGSSLILGALVVMGIVLNIIQVA